jgi:hypothetical protein
MKKEVFSAEHQRFSQALIEATRDAKKLVEREELGEVFVNEEFEKAHERIRQAAEGLENLWKALRSPEFKWE